MNLPDFYRRALALLGLTNKDLADLLTAARHDGQVTSQATVSRWVTGATPMDAGVLLFLTSQLRQMTREMVRRPTRSRVIGVGGGKGGVGGSTMAVALSLVSHHCGYRTLHISSHEKYCNERYFLQRLPPAIHHSGPISKNDINLDQYDFIFIDVYRDLVRDAAEGENEAASILDAIDLFVTPLNITSVVDLWGIQAMYKRLDEIGKDHRILVHTDSALSILGFDNFYEVLEPWSHTLYKSAIPRVCNDLFVDGPMGLIDLQHHAGFSTEDLYFRFWQLFAEILEHFGLDAEEAINPSELDFCALVDLLAPPVRC